MDEDLVEAVLDQGFEQGSVVREVAVNRPDPDARLPGDLVQRRREVAARDDLARDLEDARAVARGVGAERRRGGVLGGHALDGSRADGDSERIVHPFCVAKRSDSDSVSASSLCRVRRGGSCRRSSWRKLMSQAALTPIVPWSAADIGDQSGRTFLVTGANSGLGFATTRELARRGAHVIMAVRDLDKGAASSR